MTSRSFPAPKSFVVTPHFVGKFWRDGIAVNRHQGIGRFTATNLLRDLAAQLGLVDKSGSYYALEGERIGQGRERSVEWLKERPQVLDSLIERIHATKRPVNAALEQEAAA